MNELNLITKPLLWTGHLDREAHNVVNASYLLKLPILAHEVEEMRFMTPDQL